PRKAGLFYTQPELVLYAIALIFVILRAIERLQDRVAPALQGLALCSMAVAIAAATVYASQPAAFPLVPVRDEWDLNRSMSQTIVGRNALIGINTQYPWYISGARYVYQFVNWGFSAKDLATDLVKKFDTFVFVGDWLGNQEAAVPFPWLYLS